MAEPSRRGHDGDDEVRRLSSQLKAARSRIARLEASWLVEQEKVRQLHEAFSRRDTEAWHQTHTIETLKIELRAIATTAASLQGKLLSVQAAERRSLNAGAGERPGRPTAEGAESEQPEAASLEAQENSAQLQAALMDLEQRLEQAVGLVLDELNNRKAAEARIGELEAQLAALRRRVAGTRGR